MAIPVFFILAAFSCGNPERNEGGITLQTISIQKKEKNAVSSLIMKGKAEIMKAVKGSDDEEEAERLNKMIAGMIYEGETDVKSALDKKQDEYVEAFKASVGDQADNGKTDFKWESFIEGKVAAVTGQFISYEVMDYSFSGGDNGTSVLSYAVFDRQSGQEAPLSFFIPEEKIPELQNLIRETLVQDKDMPSYEALRSDYLTEDIETTNNFYADDLGVHFVYNPGEIAAYSEGSQNILVRWDALKPLLNPGIIE